MVSDREFNKALHQINEAFKSLLTTVEVMQAEIDTLKKPEKSTKKP